MALILKEKEYEHDTVINNLKSKLSHLTQRWVLEKFYQIFWEKLIEKQLIRKDQKQKCITKIKRMTHQPEYKQCIDEIFDIVNARGLEISNIPEWLIYGHLSEMIHKAELT